MVDLFGRPGRQKPESGSSKLLRQLKFSCGNMRFVEGLVVEVLMGSMLLGAMSRVL